MDMNEGRCEPNEPTSEDLALGRLMALWQHGDAARHDPVLLNMQARIAAELRRVAPGAAEKGRALFERLTAGDRGGVIVLH